MLNIRFLYRFTYIYNFFVTEGILSDKLYDKRDDLNFNIVNLPCICSSIPESLVGQEETFRGQACEARLYTLKKLKIFFQKLSNNTALCD